MYFGIARRQSRVENDPIDRKEETMPHVIVKLWPGKSEQQKPVSPTKSPKMSWRFSITGGLVSVGFEEIKSKTGKEGLQAGYSKQVGQALQEPGYEM